MVTDLTGMQIANASMLDEGTAAAEAMTLAHRVKLCDSHDASVFFVSDNCHPQTIDIDPHPRQAAGQRLRRDG